MRRTFLLHHGIPTRKFFLMILFLGALLLRPHCLWATGPITPSGLNTQVSDPIIVGAQTQYNITGGTRPGGGANLFHSFGEFGVPTNNIANFQNTLVNGAFPHTDNILARVTGSSGNNPTLSSIYGTIQTTDFGNANLFLMNPAGFLFGPNATVNVGGMMAFTSADYLKLTDGARFNAIPSGAADALLTALPVAAFGFLGSNPGAITVQGSQFSVTDGQSISLVGGDIEVTAGTLDNGTTVQPARFAAPGGQINLTSVTSHGEVLATSFLPEAGMTRGSVTLSQGALLDVSANTAGTVRIRSGSFVMDNATISADTVNANGAPVAVDINLTGDLTISDTRGVSAITAKTTGLGNAGEVLITSTNLEATSSARSLFSPIDTHFALIDTHTSGSGTAGNVSIETTGNLNVTGQPTGPLFFIDSGTVGLDGGHGGAVTMTAENIQLQNANISTGDAVAVNSLQDSAGSGGHVTITADTLSMTRSVIATDGFWAGRAGDLTINVRDIDMNTFSGLSLLEFEGGGKLIINADRLIADSAQFDSETVFGPGGGFTITAKVVELKNGTTLRSQTLGDGDAGDIRITATDHLTLADRFSSDANDLTTLGARVRPTGLYTNSLGSSDLGTLGNAGSIIVTTPRLEMIGGARINSTTQSNGHGGDVIITATNQITISGERPTEVIEEGLFGLGSTRASGIYTRTIGSEFCTGTCGDAGHVSITTGSLTVSNGAVINSGTTSTGRGGDITVHETDMISISGTMVDGTPGGVFSQTIGTDPNAGKGGNIILKANSVTIQNGAQLSASSFGPGAAGNVTVEGVNSPAQSVLIDGPGSGIFTDTEGTGAGGSIFVNANSVTIQNGGTLSAATSGTAPSATGGTITMDANQVQLLTGGLITAATTGPGNAGSVTINAAESVTFADPPLSVPSRIITSTSGSGNGGDVTMTVGQSVSLTGNQSEISGNQSGIFTNTSGTGNAGNVNINADTLTLANRAQIQANTLPGSEGRSGNIDIQVIQASLTGSSSILTNTVGLGDAGSIRIRADKSISLVDSNINNSSFDFFGSGAGNAGLIWLTAPTISLQHGELISLSQGPGNAGHILLEGNSIASGIGSTISSETIGPGRGGDITVRGLNGSSSRADDVTISGGSVVLSQTSGEGDAGNIDIMTERMALTDGSGMFSASGAGGNAGNIKIDAGESVQISSFSLLESDAFGTGNAGHITVITPTVTVRDGGFISTSTTASGNAGTITINATSVNLLNGGHLTSSTLNFAPESPELAPTGNAGIVTIEGTNSPAQSVQINGPGSGIFTETQSTGAGGNIFVNANSVTLQNGAHVTSSSTGTGIAGDITINAGNQFAMTNSTVTTEANLASGGAIKITTDPSGTVQLTNSTISASVLDGAGGGGSVNIDPQFVILLNSQILANAVQGPGGNISITTNLLLPDATSVISASSQFGVNGTVTIQSPNAPISGQIQPLGKTPLIATSLLNQHCASLAGGEFSSFTVAGRDSLPTEPGGWLASPFYAAGMGPGVKAEGGKAEGESAGAGQVESGQWRVGDTPILSLRQIAPAGFLTQAFAVDWSASCQS